MESPSRKRHRHHRHHKHKHHHRQQQMEANEEEVNGIIINHLPNAADVNGNNNNNNNNEESGWKMAALEARNRMLEVTLEYNGLRAENLALRGKTKTLEAEQAVQLENAEKFGEFLQKMMSGQEQNRMGIAVLKEENLTIWRKLIEAEQKEVQQRKEIDELKVLNQAGTKALWRQVKEAEQKLVANQNNLAELPKRMTSLEQKQDKEIAQLKLQANQNNLAVLPTRMASLEQKQEKQIADLKNNLAEFTKRMEQKHEKQMTDLKLQANQNNLAVLPTRMASLKQKHQKEIADLKVFQTNNFAKITKGMELKHEKEIADLKNNLGEFTNRMASLEEKQEIKIANLKHNLAEYTKTMEQKHQKEIADLKVENVQLEANIQYNFAEFTKRMAHLEGKQEKQMTDLKKNLGEFTRTMASLEQKQERENANLKNNLGEFTKRMENLEQFTKRMEQMHKNEIADLKVENMQLEANIQNNLAEFTKRMASFEEKHEKRMADFENNLGHFTKNMEQKHETEIANLKVENLQLEENIQNNFGEFTKRMACLEEKHEKRMADLKNNFAEFTKRMASLEQKQDMEIAHLKVENLQLSENTQIVEQMGELGKKLAILWPFAIQDKRLLNPKANGWSHSNTGAQICPDGLGAISSNTSYHGWHNVFASQRFGISAEQCRKDFYPGTILYYFEVIKKTSSVWAFYIGLATGHIPDNVLVQSATNFYGFPTLGDQCYLAGKQHKFEWPTGAICRPVWNWNGLGDTLGCGILLNPKNELAIFFTANGILMGKQIPLALQHPCDFLIPTVSMKDVSVEANFGHDLATKPFKYDIEKWPGLIFQP